MVEHAPWDFRIALDLYLGGMGIGLFMLVVLLRYLDEERYGLLAKRAAYLAPVFVGAGMTLLMTELGKPLNAYVMMISFNPVSLTSWGTMIQSAFVGLAAIYALLLRRLTGYDTPESKLDKLFNAVLDKIPLKPVVLFRLTTTAGILLAVLIGIYHGALLASLGRPLWATWMTPVLFLASSLLNSAAVLIIVAAVVDRGQPQGKLNLTYLLLCLSVIQLASIFAWQMMLARSGPEAEQTVKLMLEQYNVLWFGLVIVLGSVLPFIGSVWQLSRDRKGYMPLKLGMALSSLVIIGGFVMKFIIVMAGQVFLPLD